MNIPTMKDDTLSLFNLSYFSHEEEMENFSKHLYLVFKGARTGVIGGNDPFEDSIIGISPKVFTLLMLARFNMCFRPVASNPAVGIMLEVPMPFGALVVYSAKPKCWTAPTAPTQHLGFTMMFNRHHQSLAHAVQEYPGLLVIPEGSNDRLVVGTTFRFNEDTHLEDVCDTVYRLVNQLSELDEKLTSWTSTSMK